MTTDYITIRINKESLETLVSIIMVIVFAGFLIWFLPFVFNHAMMNTYYQGGYDDGWKAGYNNLSEMNLDFISNYPCDEPFSFKNTSITLIKRCPYTNLQVYGSEIKAQDYVTFEIRNNWKFNKFYNCSNGCGSI